MKTFSYPQIAVQLSGAATEATLADIDAKVSTAAKQDTGNTSLASIDGKTPALGQALAASSVPVVLPAAQITSLTPPTTVTVTQATGTNLHTVVDSSALPTGAATSALQTSGNSSLSSIDGKTPALGQALAALSVPVVLPAAQITALTPPTTVTVTQATGTNLHTVVDSGTVTANIGTTNGLALDASLTTLNTSVNTLLKPASTLAAVTTVGAVTSITNALPTGSNVIGKVSIDQTTPGTTNLVAANNTQINGTAILAGNGVTGTGSQRVTIASDNSPIPSVSAPSSSSTNAASSSDSTALEAGRVIKASAGRLFTLSGVNTSASAQYIQVFNSATIPADGAAPVLLAYVPAGSTFSWSFYDIGKYFSTGISVSNSSTAATKTAGSANCYFNAEYL